MLRRSFSCLLHSKASVTPGVNASPAHATSVPASAPLHVPLPKAQAKLVLCAYRTLLKEARFFDSRPLAKAMLSASPFLRHDSSWLRLVNEPDQSKVSYTPQTYAGISENTLVLPAGESSLTMKEFVRQQFRAEYQQWDASRFFSCMKRLEQARNLHEQCSVAIAPNLPDVEPKLQLLPRSATVSKGSLLLAHPVLVEDFSQAVVLVTGRTEETVKGLTLNCGCGSCDFALEPHRLVDWSSERLYKLISPKNVKHFSTWNIYSGGPAASSPVVLHRSPAIAKAVDAIPRPLAKLASDDATAALVGTVGKWFLHPLTHVLAIDPKVLQAELPSEESARIIMNHCDWELDQLQTELAQNWWLATSPKSSLAALPSLLCPPKVNAVAPDNLMWQRSVANLGGELSDFARLHVVADRDYAQLIEETFGEDL